MVVLFRAVLQIKPLVIFQLLVVVQTIMQIHQAVLYLVEHLGQQEA